MQSVFPSADLPDDVKRLGIQERIQMRVAKELAGQVQPVVQTAETVQESEKDQRRFLLIVLSVVLIIIAGLGIWCYSYTHSTSFRETS